jgi:hypothetical protein
MYGSRFIAVASTIYDKSTYTNTGLKHVSCNHISPWSALRRGVRPIHAPLG